MAEMPDVIGGEVVSSDWGNDIRDRTIQRYATAAARTAAHLTPVDGDLSFLTDTGLVYVYYSGTWRTVGAFDELDSADSDAAANTTNAYAVIGTVSLTIPSDWDQWKCLAQVSWVYDASSSATASFKLVVDGLDSNIHTLRADNPNQSGSFLFRRVNLITTGSRTISFQAKHNESTFVSLSNIFLYARATRTA